MAGPQRRSRTHHAKWGRKRVTKAKAFTRQIDQIQLVDLLPESRAKLEAQPVDLELPGLGQHYCVECAKYFESDVALKSHWKGKVHKRQCKRLREPAYTIEESELAAGLGREGKRPQKETQMETC
ncbi:uncharacterized protein EI90DRAFT_3130351 [Cantharellus anzutake]|uniref:uncharacterized protein n=1 Tax=Cantharellus anzutake TaxID=1750568 RepID=UPI001905EDD8|nr:uncharacterized protein EI90DRAFT_3130351 [Cantharellus anzutake]KAF8323484.1 hypothetical protein EI90DRAFT_3130351 [Cantharellus anzutake]